MMLHGEVVRQRDESRSPCLDCKDYKKCPRSTKDWFAYYEIRFCPYQVIFIIYRVATFRDSKWPESPYGRNDIAPGVRAGFRNEAYFVKPKIVLAEVEYRLRRVTRDAREALIDEIMMGKIDLDDFSRPAKRALMYVKGFRRKKQTFSQWRRGEKEPSNMMFSVLP